LAPPLLTSRLSVTAFAFRVEGNLIHEVDNSDPALALILAIKKHGLHSTHKADEQDGFERDQFYVGTLHGDGVSHIRERV
jgi:hypothetical protein